MRTIPESNWLLSVGYIMFSSQNLIHLTYLSRNNIDLIINDNKFTETLKSGLIMAQAETANVSCGKAQA
jgi:hypothetical protein